MQDPLRHEALPYSGHEQFVSSSVAVLRDGLDRDERLIFLAAQAKVDDVRDALGPDVQDVTLVPTDEHGRNPARITTMLDSFRTRGDTRRALGVTDPMASPRSASVQSEAQLAESVLNSPMVQPWAMSIICLYDTGQLDDVSLHDMRLSHPVIRGEADDNADYDASLLDTLYGSLLPPPPPDASMLDMLGPQLVEMREFVRENAAAFGIAADRVDDLVLAANEIGTNSVRHAGGRCTVRMWAADNAAICEVLDGGHLRDPLIGRFPPPPESTSGRGLWLAHHLCDLVQIRSSEAGTIVRLFVER